MNSSLSPPILYLEDDDEVGQHQSTETSIPFRRDPPSTDMNIGRKKRKLSNARVRINPTVVNWPKRHRNSHYQEQSSQNCILPDCDPEPIILDPDEYIIEDPDSHAFRSFDWTIQPQSTTSLTTKIPSNSIQAIPRISNTSTSNINNVTQCHINKPDRISATNSNNRSIQHQRELRVASGRQPSSILLPLPVPRLTSSTARPNVLRGRPVKDSRASYTQSVGLKFSFSCLFNELLAWQESLCLLSKNFLEQSRKF